MKKTVVVLPYKPVAMPRAAAPTAIPVSWGVVQRIRSKQ